MKFDRPRSGNEEPERRSEPGIADWLDNNMVRPAYNAGVVQPLNALANVGNGIFRTDAIGKLTPAHVERADSLAAEMFQGVSGGLAGLWPYIAASKLMGSGLRAGGRAIGLEGGLAKFAGSETAAMMTGAALYDFARDTNPGETTWGNVASGVAGFGIYGSAHKFTRGLSFSGRLPLHAMSGAIGGEAQLLASKIISGQDIEARELREAAWRGASMNVAIPLVQHPFNRVAEHFNNRFDRATPGDRFAQNYNLDKSPTFRKLLRTDPLLRFELLDTAPTERLVDGRWEPGVRTTLGGPSHLDYDARVARIDPSRINQDAGHEVAHRMLARQAEPKYREAARLLGDGATAAVSGVELPSSREAQAKRLFLETRRDVELQATRLGDRVAAELEAKASRKPFEPPKDRPLDSSYERLFENEWRQFRNSGGAYRPHREYSLGGAASKRSSGET